MSEEIYMQHNMTTIKRLADVQYNVFSGWARNLYYLLSLLGILLGFGLIYDFGKPTRYLFLAAGCILFANIGASASIKADQTLQAIQRQGGKFPLTKMSFSSSGVRVKEEGGQVEAIKYSDFLRLAEDSKYYYLFITKEAAYMVPKEQIKDDPAFRSLLKKGSGKKIVRSTGLFSLRLRDIIQNLKR